MYMFQIDIYMLYVFFWVIPRRLNLCIPVHLSSVHVLISYLCYMPVRAIVVTHHSNVCSEQVHLKMICVLNL
jgi:hypothetical protein